MTDKVNIMTVQGADVAQVSLAVANRIRNWRKDKKLSLDELSRLERRGRTDIQTLASTIVHQEPQASVVMIATGAGTSMESLRRACATFDLDTRVVGVLVDPEAKITVRNVANVSLVRLANLSELGRAMRRAMP